MRTGTARVLTPLILSAALALVFAAPALAAPRATEAAFTNPVAYELKSLLSTRFYCTVDTAGTWAVLDVFSADGIVKTVYSGPVSSANQRVYFPAWEGKDYLGRRMPSASYEWRLTLSKGGQSSVTRGKITVSKINFFVKGEGWPEGSTSDFGVQLTDRRYMMPGNANMYIQAWETSTTVNGARLTADVYYPGWLLPEEQTAEYQHVAAFDYALANDQVLRATTYLRGSDVIRNRGTHEFTVLCPNATFYITVIQ